MFVIGITGGIASGKRALTGYLKREAAAIIDADEIARDVIAPGTTAFTALVERFGTSILNNDGSINRPVLRNLIFEDAGNVDFINRVTHPEIIKITRDRLKDLVGTLARDDIVLLRVPLMAETGLDSDADLVIAVAAREETRVARIVGRRGLTETDAKRIIAAQASDEERAKIADIVVKNDGSLSDLEEQAQAALEEARRRIREKRG
jgi:dephospho-CoA kinase